MWYDMIWYDLKWYDMIYTCICIQCEYPLFPCKQSWEWHACICNPPINLETIGQQPKNFDVLPVPCIHVPWVPWPRHGAPQRLSAQWPQWPQWPQPRWSRPGFVPAWRQRLPWRFGSQWPLRFSTDGSNWGKLNFWVLMFLWLFFFSIMIQFVCVTCRLKHHNI